MGRQDPCRKHAARTPKKKVGQGHAAGDGIPGVIVDDILDEDSATNKRSVAKNKP
jgi:hypothetical protein